MEFLRSIDGALGNLANIIQLAVALSTIAAAYAAFYAARVALQAQDPKVSFECDLRRIWLPDLNGSDGDYTRGNETISATFVNRSMYKILIPYHSIGITVPLGKIGAQLNPKHDFRRERHLELEPFESLSFELCDPEQFRQHLSNFPIEWFRGARLRRLRITCCLAHGDVVRARLGDALLRRIALWTRESRLSSGVSIS